MNANDFTWEQRGAIDYTIGVPFSGCNAVELFDRDQWERGYIDAEERRVTQLMWITGQTKEALRAHLRQR